MAAGLAESIARRGYRRTTVRDIIASSGISRQAFYRHFGDKAGAFVGAHAEALTWLTARLSAAAATEAEWPRKVSAAIAVALHEAAHRPCEAQLLAGDPFAAGPRTGYCQELLIARFAPSLRAGRRAAAPLPLPPSLEEALLGSLIGVVSDRLRGGSVGTLPLLAPALSEFVLSPYLGAEQARQAAHAPLRAVP
jgi:AcrR family transcriptional regulator